MKDNGQDFINNVKMKLKRFSQTSNEITKQYFATTVKSGKIFTEIAQFIS